MTQDILAAMIESQRILQEAHGHDFENMTDIQRMEYIRTMTLACTDELHEALNETGWKPWASSNHINREEWMGEMADTWLFFMNLMLAGGMTAEDLIIRTAKKQDNAYVRMNNGYNGVSTKCPVCRRAYDNEGVKCKSGAVGPQVCAYIPEPKQTGIITHSEYPSNMCPGCGNPYDSNIAKNCFPQGQGFGWCAVRAQTIGLQVVEQGA
jgi:hypothetical protein